MKAIRIDVTKKTFEVVEISDYKDIYKHIGNDCSMFECPFSFDNGDAIYVDEEGLYHDFEGGFKMKDWSYPVVGNALILGTDFETGESQSVLTKVEELQKQIIFVSKQEFYNTVS